MNRTRIEQGLAGAASVVVVTLLSGCGSEPPKDAIGRGQQAVVSRSCESCHTPSSNPNAPFSGADKPYEDTHAYPPNLTPDPDTGIGGWSDDLVVRAILTGIDDEDAELCDTMPRFKDKGMTEAEAKDIVAYLRALPPVNHAVPESTCPPLKPGETGDGGEPSGGDQDDAGKSK